MQIASPRLTVTGLVACASLACAQTATDFAARADVVVPSAVSVVRAALPGSSIAALRGANGGDLRVFNGSGLSLPHALIDASSEAHTRPDAPGQRLPALPIYAATSTSASTPTLRIEEGPTRRVIEFGSAKLAPGGKQEPRGLLFDTRKIDAEVRALELEGVLPNATIVKLTLDISPDLKSWRTLVNEAPVFDFGSDGPANRRIALPATQSFKDHYIRMTWNMPGALPVIAMTTVGAGSVRAIAPASLELGAASGTASDAAEWTLPSGLRVSGLRLQTSANNALMPVRVLTRARAGDPWQPVASTVVYRLTGADGVVGVNPSLPLNAVLSRELRVEALRGYSLSGVPLTLSVEHPPLHVVFVATGDGPFTIATGKAGLESAALPVSTLIPNYKSGAEFALPVVQATPVAVAAANKGASAAASLESLFNRSTMLWAVLGLAVVVLAGLAVSLLRTPVKK
jgi:hypothetical protein